MDIKTLYTTDTYEYTYSRPVNATTNTLVSCTFVADSNVHLLFDTGATMKFELVLGGWNNTKSALRMSKQGSIISETNTLTLSKENTLDITWYNRQFTITLNNTTWNVKIPPGNNIPPFTKVWFSTGFGSKGTFTFSQGTQEFGTKPSPPPVVKKKPVQEKPPPKEEVKVEPPNQEPLPPKEDVKVEPPKQELLPPKEEEEVQTAKEESKPKKKSTSRSKKKNVV